MKRKDLLKELRSIATGAGLTLDFVRQGANHEIWTIGTHRLVVPRHREVNEHTARGILATAEQETADDDQYDDDR